MPLVVSKRRMNEPGPVQCALLSEVAARAKLASSSRARESGFCLLLGGWLHVHIATCMLLTRIDWNDWKSSSAFTRCVFPEQPRVMQRCCPL